MKMKTAYFLLIPLLGLLLASCKDDDEKMTNQPKISRTIIVYMAADNDLSEDALNDIEEMKQSFSGSDVNFLVFADLKDENPYLLKLEGKTNRIIQTYPELNSANPAVLKEVLSDIIEKYPADEYGLILWSHGTSWMPQNMQLRSFGYDSGKQINIPELAESLPVHFNFVLFDACLMGAVEVAYELKDKTDYIIASSTETIYEGFPYDKIVPELIQPQINLQSIAQKYFNFYNSLKDDYRSATITLIETKQLAGLAEEVRKIVTENEIDSSFNRKTVQRLDVYDEQYVFDLADYINKAYPDADKHAFINSLNQTVLYKNSTPMFLSMYEIKMYCGLSCYIPHPKRNDLNAYYKSLKWNIDTFME